MPALDILLCLLVSFFWGINYIAIKTGVTDFHPLFAMALRYLMVIVLLFPWILKTPRELIKPIIVASIVMGGIYFSLFFTGMSGVPAGEGAIIMQAQVPMSALLSSVFFKERLSFRIFTGIVLAMIGVTITIGMPKEIGSIVSITFLLLAAFFWAVGNILTKKLGKVDPLMLNADIALISFPILMLLSYIFEPHAFQSIEHPTWQGIAAIAYMAIFSTIFCYSIWFKMLQKHHVSKILPFNLLVPILAVLSADLITKEPISLHELIGCILCVSGLALVLLKKTG
jgi:O-acetylserine/cysteine efflux transporter